MAARLDPIYDAYIHSRDVPGAWITPRDRSHGPPKQPATNMSKFEGDLSHARSNYEHFHMPNNESNRFLSSAAPTDRAAYRDIPRKAPYPHTAGTSARPSSAQNSPAASRDSSPARPSSPSRTKPSPPPSRSPSKLSRPANSNVGGTQASGISGHARPPHTQQAGSTFFAQSSTPSTSLSPSQQTQQQQQRAGSPVVSQQQQQEQQQRTSGGVRHANDAASPSLLEQCCAPASPTASQRRLAGPGSPTASERKLSDNMTTPTGSPCYTFAACMEADLAGGGPLAGSLAPGEEWRAARVLTYQVHPSSTGYAKGGSRPFHADYRHYKYYGFAGKGAKTSWAHNPKYSDVKPAQARSGGEPSSRKPLTTTEKEIVRHFTSHGFSADGAPSQLASPQQHTSKQAASPVKAERSGTLLPRTEIIEPYYEFVDRESRQPLPGKAFPAGSNVAQVSTYRMVSCPSPLAFTHSSPNHGSQSPATQRYSHYKTHGFAGKGATSSWARNPKYEVLQV
ncbi:MAG: hypothetical protein WDW38_006989 [Sanguina aurantia]